MTFLGRLASRFYLLALLAFPKRHRTQYRDEMLDAFTLETTGRARRTGAWSALRFGVAASLNAISAGLGERRRGRRSDRRGRTFVPGTIARDLIYAVRSLAKARAFTVVCALSLGVGMGTVLAVVIIVRGITGPPPGVDADRLVELLITPTGSLRAQTGGRPVETWSFPDFKDVRDADTGMTITGWAVVRSAVTLPGDGGVTHVPAMYVAGNYFANIGIGMSHGRGFDAAQGSDAPAPPEAIVGYEFWQNKLGGDPSAVGRTITINRVEYAIIGIAQRGFQSHRGPEGGAEAEVWLPLSRHPLLTGPVSARLQRDKDWVRVLGRLSPGTSLAQANAAVSSIMAGIGTQFPGTNEFKRPSVEPYFAMGAVNRFDAELMRAALISTANIVLLIVCVNISGMVLVRAAARERELAVRLAMGASRGRLIQCLLAESTVLAFAGGAIAAAVLFGGPRLVMWWFDTPHSADLDLLLRLDRVIVAVCVGISFVTSLVFGLLPAIRFSRPILISALKDETGTSGRRTGRVHRWTTALQAGLAVPFLVLSVVMLGQFRAGAVADLGFKPTGLFAASLDLEGAGYQGAAAEAYRRTVHHNLTQAAGMTSVTVADGLPLDRDSRVIRISHEGVPGLMAAQTTRIGEHYLETLGIRLLRGRTITAADDSSTEPVTVVSESLAARLFADGNALGHKLAVARGGRTQLVTIVGVSADVVTAQIDAARAQLFLSLSQLPASRVLMIARSSADERSTQDAFAQAFTGLEPETVRARVFSADEFVHSSLEGLRSQSMMAGVLGAVALSLTALGVFGVIGFMVATRTREIGVRMALGASRRQVLEMVLRDTVRLVLPGVAIGLVLAALLAWSQNIAWYSQPLAYAIAAMITLGVALLSGLPAARRAAAVEPLIAMRSE
jgi:predicted permease